MAQKSIKNTPHKAVSSEKAPAHEIMLIALTEDLKAIKKEVMKLSESKEKIKNKESISRN